MGYTQRELRAELRKLGRHDHESAQLLHLRRKPLKDFPGIHAGYFSPSVSRIGWTTSRAAARPPGTRLGFPVRDTDGSIVPGMGRGTREGSTGTIDHSPEVRGADRTAHFSGRALRRTMPSGRAS